MLATAKTMPVTITRARPETPIFVATGRDTISIRARTVIGGDAFAGPIAVILPELVAGTDYAIVLEHGAPIARACGDGVPADAVGGFHFAPGGNATARGGGDTVPAINPCSIWDARFRPVCPDPRGMALVERDGLRFWCDIYLLGVDHAAKGTSRFGAEIADGYSLADPAAKGRKSTKLDYPTAVAVYAQHDKQLLTYDEFRAAAFGVTEKTAHRGDPETVKLDAPRTSQAGIIQATGNLWVWGTDGDPDEPRPSIFGGSWFYGGNAGSRYANLGSWPGNSGDNISARGRGDHLMLD